MEESRGTHRKTPSLNIDTSDDDAIRRWCGRFKCTPDDLLQAVTAVGPGAAEVLDYFAARRSLDRAAPAADVGAAPVNLGPIH